MKKLKLNYTSVLTLLLIVATLSCKDKNSNKEAMSSEKRDSLAFEQRIIVDSAKFWWAHIPQDIDGDKIVDLVFINNNASGGYLGYYKGQKEDGLWQLKIIAEAPPTGGLFASGDLETADIDGDGDQDVIGVKHPGEWTDAGANAELFWYENQGNSWVPHSIGTAPDAVKDISITDFNLDGKMDVAILTFDEHTLSIFKQVTDDEWPRVQYIVDEVLHEGMHTGDLNQDGYPDIVATGLIFENPGEDISAAWKKSNLDAQWNNQTGDWSRNGTKTFIQDIDGDEMPEIFMGHSERAGYPLTYYKKENGVWKPQIITDSIPANHTLQVFDFDLDGDFDVFAGVNTGRAVNLGYDKYPVVIYLKNDSGTYDEFVINEEGVYNGQAIDFDGDGDMDIFRYPDHESKNYYLLENKLIP